MVATRAVPITDCPNGDDSILVRLTEGRNCASEVDDGAGDKIDVTSLALGTNGIFPMGFGLNRFKSSMKLFVRVSHNGKIPKVLPKSSGQSFSALTHTFTTKGNLDGLKYAFRKSSTLL